MRGISHMTIESFWFYLFYASSCARPIRITKLRCVPTRATVHGLAKAITEKEHAPKIHGMGDDEGAIDNVKLDTTSATSQEPPIDEKSERTLLSRSLMIIIIAVI